MWTRKFVSTDVAMFSSNRKTQVLTLEKLKMSVMKVVNKNKFFKKIVYK